MNLGRYKLILYATFVAFILHTIEEYQSKLFEVDGFILTAAKNLDTSPLIIFFIIQTLVFLLIVVSLVLVTKNKLNKPLAIMLGVIFIFELSHLYSSIAVSGYYPGMYSGIALIIIGYFYWKEMFKLLNRI
jgi:hypothetical protein